MNIFTQSFDRNLGLINETLVVRKYLTDWHMQTKLQRHENSKFGGRQLFAV